MIVGGRRRATALAVALALATAACSSSSDGDAAPEEADGEAVTCPERVDEAEFASAEELHELLATFNEFGLRSPGSTQGEASLDWLGEQFAAIDGVEVTWDTYEIDRWQPTPEAEDAPGRDLAAAGALRVDGDAEVPVAGAVPYTTPTGDDGVTAPMVHLAAGEEITAADAAGKVVVQEIEHGSLPYAAFGAIGQHLTDDVPTEGDYDRPYLRPIDEILTAAGVAGAAGLVMVWDAPTDQVAGYWAPHTGTRYRLPAVYVGRDGLDDLLARADAGEDATVVVRAEWDRATTRSLFATVPGGSRERIVFDTNNDAANWIQENGTIAALGLARYLASLPLECRPRDIQFALTANHLGFTGDGNNRFAPQLDRDYDEGTVAFVMGIEHLGAREVLPDPVGRLAFSGEAEVYALSAPSESPVLVEATIDAVEGRDLPRTAVLQGVGTPVAGQVPQICSQGGLGTPFHDRLIPTIGGISGPWSMFAPSFGADAVDADLFRSQTLAFGDITLALGPVDRDEIAGDYLAAREQRAAGTVELCPTDPPPAEAPGP